MPKGGKVKRLFQMALKQLHIIIVTAFCMVALVINVNLIQSQHSIQQIPN
ncbi:hypothetical protein HMPREF9441_00112 [Paraprevotella clara YIT 11840]|uniref:Uncharacterized protein n=1 Tax=Paraprevotella clara YIT 11840 TaxID=762968 RepID=G5SL93_9BACT|nr:hypothetical protein HMPREF9441_00112 [Paraprevotella clara YIT 11840]